MKRAVLTLLPLLAVAWLGGAARRPRPPDAQGDTELQPDPATATGPTGVL